MAVNLKISDLLKKEEKLIFLAGAGCSVKEPSNLSTSKIIKKQILNFICYKSELSNLSELINHIRLEELLDLFQKYVDSNLKVLEYFAQCDKPNILHFFLAEMIKKKKCVITTNFDSLIEYALLNLDVPEPKVIPVISKDDFLKFKNPYYLFEDNECPVYKIHGSVRNIIKNKETKKSLITTIRDISSNKEGLNIFQFESFKLPFFECLKSESTLIVLGYSGSDDFDVIPTLKALKCIKNIFWINHIKDDTYIFKFKEVSFENNRKSNMDDLDKILREISKNKNIEHIYRIDANTGNLIKNLLTIKPKLPKDDFSLSFRDWLCSNIKKPDFFHQYFFTYTLYLALNNNKDALRVINALYNVANNFNNYTWKANALNARAQIFLNLGENDKAKRDFLRAIRILSGIHNYRDLFIVYNNYAHFFLNQGFFKDALKWLKKAKELSKFGIIEDRASIFNNIGKIYKELGNYKRAKKNYRKAINIDSSILLKARHYNNIAIIYKMQGEYEKAFDVYSKALKITNKLFDIQAESEYFNNIANIYLAKSHYFYALKYYKNALENDKRLGKPLMMSSHLNNAGKVFERIGKYYSALLYYKKSFQIDREYNNMYGKAVRMNNIGAIIKELGYYKLAQKLFNMSVEISNKIGNKSKNINYLCNIGTLRYEDKDYKCSLASFTESYKIAKKLKLYPKLGLILNNIAYTHLNMNKYSKASRKFRKALKLNKKYYDLNDQSNSIIGIGLIFRNKNNFFEALKYFKKALQINRKIINQLGKLKIFIIMAETYEIMGNNNNSYILYNKAYRIMKKLEICNIKTKKYLKTKLMNLKICN